MNNLRNIFIRTKSYWYVLIFSLLITGIISHLFFLETKTQAYKDFNSEINLLETSLDNKLVMYEQILKGVKGIFTASDSMDRKSWDTYMEEIDFKQNFSALKWIGFAEIMEDKTTKNSKEKSVYTKYIYPHNAHTENLLSYDLSANKIVMDAINKARISGQAVTSNRIFLNEKEDLSLMIMPLHNYKDNKKQTEGYIYTPFANNYSLNRILNPFRKKVGISIYEGKEINSYKLLYKNFHSPNQNFSILNECLKNLFNFTMVKHYMSYGKDYTIVYNSLIDETVETYGFKWLLMLLIGISFSLLLFFVVRSLVLTNLMATELAKEMTKEINKNKEELEALAHYDSLTGIINRYFFKKTLTHALSLADRYKHEVALFFIDLDEFKKINDTLGHEVGDCVLKEVATRMKGCLREMDTVGRLGGDEFVIIIEKETQIANLSNIATTIIDKINEPIIVNNVTLQVGCSVGIAIYPNNAITIEELMKQADIAMYSIKNTGKNQFLISDKKN